MSKRRPIEYGAPSDGIDERLGPPVLLSGGEEFALTFVLPVCSACGAYAHRYGDWWECDNGHRVSTGGHQ